ncbi:MAG: UDP-N-acetylmuramoyl-L-alanyl-D-glutamate--2,6-diaminopimelate ligase [Betaproteobacteria bacterium]|nr:UDP-N-acetylmuramoyl-L-alanyl-D-glutamate--2,6-diaminopimelate ligase [Betaproteobacteria bacterium]
MRILDELRRMGVTPSGLSADSRRLQAGEIFVAMPGINRDGRDYIEDAVARGAAAVLLEEEGRSKFPAVKIPRLAVSHLNRQSGELAHLVYGRPSEKLWMIGVTGTNGKTSVSQWIAQAFGILERKCAVIGTLGNGFPGALIDSPNTTPDVISVHRALAGFAAAQAEACAMEVSSIGLAAGRVAAVDFDVAVHTNLTRDHLDYHGGMEAYGAAKARLFAMPKLSAAVVNLDDAFGRKLSAGLAGSGVRRIGYTLDKTAVMAGQADDLIAAENLTVNGSGLSFTLRTAQGKARVAAQLLGRFNVSNLLAVLGALLASGVALAPAAAALEQLTPPPGRMQAVVQSQGKEPLVIVDYAHTPDALEQALNTLREVATARGGRLLCLFGCGGERDSGKRPLMGEAAARLADWSIVSSDNPRSENPQAIIADILRGMAEQTPVEPDRAVAIRTAVLAAAANDVLLIAGKGHECYQEIAGRRLPFSDLEQAQAALAAWRAAA